MNKLFLMFLIVVLANVSGGPLEMDTRALYSQLENPKLVERYIGCFTGERNCEGVDLNLGNQFLDFVPQALRGECRTCTVLEKKNLRIIVVTIQRKYPRCWKLLVEIFMEHKKNNLSSEYCTGRERT